MTTEGLCKVKTLRDVELLSSYKNVNEFLKLKSYLGILDGGGGKLSKGAILLIMLPPSPCMFFYKTSFYLLNLLRVN